MMGRNDTREPKPCIEYVRVSTQEPKAEAMAFAASLRPIIEQFAVEDMSMTAIAAELNRRRIKTPGRGAGTGNGTAKRSSV
jgi:hypothetical protein